MKTSKLKVFKAFVLIAYAKAMLSQLDYNTAYDKLLEAQVLLLSLLSPEELAYMDYITEGVIKNERNRKI